MSNLKQNQMLTSNFAKLPEVRIYESRKSMGEAAANRLSIAIESILRHQNEVNIIFAAAPSQNDFLAALFYENIPWQKVNAFHMDEYINLDDDAPQRFGNFLKERIFNKFNFKSVHYLNGNVADIGAECARYSQLLADYPTDIVCMGIGENGHLAFNDPPVADFDDKKKVKVVDLDLACRRQQVNDGCFAALDQVPLQALTLTIPVLMSAMVINCVVPGNSKANAVLNTLARPIDPSCPSTILRRHEGAIVFLDPDSAKYIL